MTHRLAAVCDFLSLQIMSLLSSAQTVGGNDVLIAPHFYQAVGLIPGADDTVGPGVLQQTGAQLALCQHLQSEVLAGCTGKTKGCQAAIPCTTSERVAHGRSQTSIATYLVFCESSHCCDVSAIKT